MACQLAEVISVSFWVLIASICLRASLLPHLPLQML